MLIAIFALAAVNVLAHGGLHGLAADKTHTNMNKLSTIDDSAYRNLQTLARYSQLSYCGTL
jgi:hypothetical protein